MHETMARTYQASGNLSPSELAIQINESAQTITNWSKRGISKQGALKIAQKFNVDINWLLTGKNSINNSGLYVGGNNTNHGTQIGLQTNYNLEQNISAEEYREKLNDLNDVDSFSLKDMPQFDIDDAVLFALNPHDLDKSILDHAERTGTFIPSDSNMFGIKIADDIYHITQSKINRHDILIIEPNMMPRSGDLILVCLDYATKAQRGILARLKIDLDGTYKIKYDDTDFVEMPNQSLICGVGVRIKQPLVENHLLKSRLNPNWDILSTLIKRPEL